LPDQHPPLHTSGTFTPAVIEDIQAKAELGRYRIRGFGTLRERRWPTFDDLTFLPATLTRIPLEGYRKRCVTTTVLGTRFAQKPITLDLPLMITGMSWGALSYHAKVALAKGAAQVESSNTTGDGGMLPAERESSQTLIYEVLPSRHGVNIHHLRMADAIELTIGQGAKPGTGGLLLGSKVSEVIARQRDLPVGVDQHSPARHPDFLGLDDMILKVEELREATDWQVPIFIKMDLRALTLEASMICGIPLVGTNRVFGDGPGWQEGHAVVGSTGRRRQP
jgi:methylamine---glutamate N-methyltransferase subunit C